MKYRLLLLLALFSACFLHGQSLTWNNPSFEGPAPGSSVSPPNWAGCQGSPDTQPGCWGCNYPAFAGSAYLGMVYWLNIPTSQESAQQLLPTPLLANTPYAMSLSLVNLDIYNGSWNGGAVVSIYGGTSSCNFSQLLWSSGSFTHSTWQTYNATFIPTVNLPYFIIRVEPGVGTTWPGVGVDNLLSFPLPVTLSAFNATLVDATTQIDWETTSEQGMAAFTVQRAGVDMVFEDIGSAEPIGQNGQTQQYAFADVNTPLGLSYYRLRMVDQNGTETTSQVKQILYSKSDQNFTVKYVYPNPANAFARMELYSMINQEVQIEVVDMAGRLVYSAKEELQEGENRLEMPTDSWLAGVYRIQVKGSRNVETKSIVIAR